MVKRQDLKRKLKASDRRRRRRDESSAASQPASSLQKPKVDVVGSITGTILDFINGSGTEVRDVVVVAAMRSFLNATSPGSDHSQVLLDRFHQAVSHNGVDTQSYRRGMREMMDLAKRHRNSENPDAFIRYLALMAE